MDQILPKLHLADRRFNADRQSARLGQILDEIEHAVDIAEHRMSGRAGAINSHRDAPRGGDLAGDLGFGEHPAQTGLRPLAEFDLDSPHWVGGHHVEKLLLVESALAVAGAKVTRPQLPDQIAALEMVLGNTPLAGVVHATSQLTTAVDRLDCRGTQRAEAHPRDVDDRRRPEGLLAAPHFAQNFGAGDAVVGVVSRVPLAGRGEREGGVLDDHVVRSGFQIVVGAKAEVVVLLLRRRVHPPPLVATEGPLFVVLGNDILPQFGADALQQITKVPHHRKVVDDGVPLLRDVAQRHRGEQ